MGNFITRIKNYFNKKKPVGESKIRIYSNEHTGYLEFTEEYMEFTEEEYELISSDLIIKRTKKYLFELENYLQASQARIHELQKVMNDFE